MIHRNATMKWPKKYSMSNTMSYPVSTDVDVAAALEMISAGSARILDVREHDEWEAGHIDGAVHVSLAQLGGRLKELDNKTPWLVICRTGGRSSRAIEVLRSEGIDVRNVNGGMRAWASAGLSFIASHGGEPEVI